MMKLTTKKTEIWIWLGLFVMIGVMSRWIEHIPNVTPIVGIALFVAYLWNWSYSVVFTVSTLLLSNWILGYDFDYVQVSVYIGLLFPSFLGKYVKKTNSFYKKYISVIGLSFVSSVFFYLITNFAVWLWSGMYEHTIDGLLFCYEMAIPFFRNTLLGDLSSSLVIFGMYDLSKIFIKNHYLIKTKQIKPVN